MPNLIHDPIYLFAACWIGSSAVRALPAPKETSHPAYIFLYGFAHALGANWDLAQGAANVLIARSQGQVK
jgi:hypothetical protein